MASKSFCSFCILSTEMRHHKILQTSAEKVRMTDSHPFHIYVVPGKAGYHRTKPLGSIVINISVTIGTI